MFYLLNFKQLGGGAKCVLWRERVEYKWVTVCAREENFSKEYQMIHDEYQIWHSPPTARGWRYLFILFGLADCTEHTRILLYLLFIPAVRLSMCPALFIFLYFSKDSLEWLHVKKAKYRQICLGPACLKRRKGSTHKSIRRFRQTNVYITRSFSSPLHSLLSSPGKHFCVCIWHHRNLYMATASIGHTNFCCVWCKPQMSKNQGFSQNWL